MIEMEAIAENRTDKARFEVEEVIRFSEQLLAKARSLALFYISDYVAE